MGNAAADMDALIAARDEDGVGCDVCGVRHLECSTEAIKRGLDLVGEEFSFMVIGQLVVEGGAIRAHEMAAAEGNPMLQAGIERLSNFELAVLGRMIHAEEAGNAV